MQHLAALAHKPSLVISRRGPYPKPAAHPFWSRAPMSSGGATTWGDGRVRPIGLPGEVE